MKIWWGWRFAFDCSLVYAFWYYFASQPHFFYRNKKMEPVRWQQRRRAFFNNPYFSDPSTWYLAYDKNYRV